MTHGQEAIMLMGNGIGRMEPLSHTQIGDRGNQITMGALKTNFVYIKMVNGMIILQKAMAILDPSSVNTEKIQAGTISSFLM